MINLAQKGELDQLELLMCYTPHTTSTDADFVGRELEAFQPDIYIPEEPSRSENELDKLESHYKKRISGEWPISKNVPNYMFQGKLLRYLQELNLKKPFRVYFLERHPKNIISISRDIHKREMEYKELANYLFDLGDLDGAIDELYEGLILQSRTLRIRAKNIERNLKSLPEDVKERFQELKDREELKVLSWISGLYSSPIIGFDNCPYTVIEKFQRIPYTQLAHVNVLRNMVMGNKVNKSYLAYSFIQNTLEKALRKEILDSVERFTKCVELSSDLSYKDIEKLSRQVSETGTRDVIIESLLKKRAV